MANYQIYFDRLDECLHVRNNPDKALIICVVLMEILDKYNDLMFNKYYFDGYFGMLFNSLREFVVEDKTEHLKEESDKYFNKAIRNGFGKLAGLLDQLANIKKTNKGKEFNSKVENLISEINKNQYLENSDIDNYIKKAISLISEFNYSNIPANLIVVKEISNNGNGLSSLLKKIF